MIALAVGFGGLAKGVTGLGFPLVAIPVIAAFEGVEHAVVVMAVPVVVTNAWLLWEHREHARAAPALPLVLATGAVGAVAGSLLLRAAAPRPLALLLAGMILAYLGLRSTSPQLHLSASAIRATAPGAGLLGGLLQGVTGISGPLVGPYVHAWGLGREAYVFAVSALFQIFTLVQAVTFAAAGMYTPRRAAESLLALAPALGALALGILLGRRVDAKRFEALVLAIMSLMGLRLLLEGLGVVGGG